MEYSFLAARLLFTFDVHIYIFHGKLTLLLLVLLLGDEDALSSQCAFKIFSW